MAINWLHLVFCSGWILAASGLEGNEYYTSDPIEQSRLMFHLLSTYDDRVPPTHEGPVLVTLGFEMSYFAFLDEAQQEARVHAWSLRNWNDPRLRWDPDQYNGTDTVLLDINKLWIPDIELYNGATILDTVKASAVVHYTGSVTYVPSFKIDFICEMDLRFFPYDTQNCYLKMGSWHYHSETLNLQTSSEVGIGLSNFMPVKDFTMVDVKAQRNLRTYACCKEEYIDVTYYFIMERKSSAYSVKLVLPSVLAGFLVLGTFLVPNTSCERLTVCAVLFLCLVHLLTYLHDIIPTSGDTILGCFLAFAMFLDFFAIISAVISYNLQRCAGAGDNGNGGNEEHEMKMSQPPMKKKGLLRFFDVGCFILFAVTFIIGLAVILSQRG